MPELPEVETVVRTLLPAMSGRRIMNVELLRTDVLRPPGFDLAAQLTDRVVAGIHRRGKKIIFELETGDRFYIHLGMSGRISIDPPTAARLRHTHLILSVDNVEIRFCDPRRFGGIWWLGREPADSDMGPEPLTLKPAQLARRLAKTKRPIKSALLDQSVVAGLGNIYVDESLFTAGIHPLTLASQLHPNQITALNSAIKLTLRRALRHRGSTLRDYRDANGDSGAFQKLHRVYDRAAQPCAVCRTPIQRIVLGGRSTHFCPKCQPAGKTPIK